MKEMLKKALLYCKRGTRSFHLSFTNQFVKTLLAGKLKVDLACTNPTPGGLGKWIQENSKKYGCSLSPRHGSFIAAILAHEGYITSEVDGNTIILYFP